LFSSSKWRAFAVKAELVLAKSPPQSSHELVAKNAAEDLHRQKKLERDAIQRE